MDRALAMAARARERDGAQPVLDTLPTPVDHAGMVALLENHLGATVVANWERVGPDTWRDTVSGSTRDTAP